MVASPGPSPSTRTRTIRVGTQVSTSNAAENTSNSRSENLAQLFREVLAELDAFEVESESGLTAESAPVVATATARDVHTVPSVQVDTFETSDTSALAGRRNRGRRRKWLAAQAAASATLSADGPSAEDVVGYARKPAPANPSSAADVVSQDRSGEQ